VADELPDWRQRGVYIRNRSRRKPGDTDIEPSWANEAYVDPDAVTFDPDYASLSGRSVRTIGYSITAGFLITVITLLDDGHLYGVNAWKSNSTDAGYYEDTKS
jgi:hypothetical protein